MKKPFEFIGEKAVYDNHGQNIWGVDKDDKYQTLVDIRVRGWGAIQNLFKEKKGNIDFPSAEKFQDDLGQWIADAINEKLEREKNECDRKIKVEQFHKKITEWLYPLGYVPIFDNHPLSKEREFHFIKERIRIVCVNGIWEDYCYLHADKVKNSHFVGIRTVKFDIGTDKLEELHELMKDLACECEEQEYCDGPYNRCTKCGKLKSAFKND